jgi:hypothetical protein
MVYAASILNAIKELTMALAFKRRHFQPEVMLMLVRWYVAYALSYRDVKTGIQNKRLMAGWDHAYLAKVLNGGKNV